MSAPETLAPAPPAPAPETPAAAPASLAPTSLAAAPAPAPALAPTFAELDLRPELVSALAGLGYEEPTPIQREAIPVVLAGRDALGQAATGTGKTAAFALPILQRLPLGRRDVEPAALVLVPTRELAMQVSEAFQSYGRQLGVRVLAVYGGQPIGHQLRALERGVDVVVATPGRAVDLLARAALRLGRVEVTVLDEADEMLDMGFADDLEAIFAAAPGSRQTVLFSATLPSRIDAIARRHLHDPVRIRIAESPTGGDQPSPVRHCAYVVARPHKAAALARILDVEAPVAALVFCRTRDQVDALTETLNGRGQRAEALHGGMGQPQRDRVMHRLRTGAAELLVATDVAARGLDIDLLSHVVNYDVPSSVESYVHRSGRVGRAGREGVAITLAEPRERRMLDTLQRATNRRIDVERVPTAADLRARRLERSRAALRATILDGNLDHFRAAVEPLAGEFDVVEIAAAALKLAGDARGPAIDEEDIPDAAPRAVGSARGPRPGRSEGPGAATRRPAGSGMTRLWVGIGREAGMRPQDLVGAITGETMLQGKQIGAIDIAPRFSLVEVPDRLAGEVVAALGGTKLRGKRVAVRRDRF